jgi:hypothetical protein
MIKVTYTTPASSSVHLFKWFKSELEANVFASTLGDRLIGFKHA